MLVLASGKPRFGSGVPVIFSRIKGATTDSVLLRGRSYGLVLLREYGPNSDFLDWPGYM